MPFEYDHDHEREITLFAETNFRNQRRRFGIKTDDRRRHMYVLGKTGMGKTTLLENLILSDINAGHGCCYVDPHGDTAEKLIDWIPSHRLNDVVYFNPADTAYPMGFNILEVEDEEQKTLVASGLMGVFKKIWPDVWSARMEYILINCVLALLDYPGSTLMGISRLLVDEEYRMRVTAKIRDPIVKTFWAKEFTSWSEKYATEAIAPVQNKVGQFLSSSTIRNIVAQVKSTINFRSIMDEGKICIVNLSKGRIGEDNMRLLGGMVVTKIQLAAQERQNIPERERRDFYLYVDEFQNFANESFATILSEARKYRLNLIVAHQYVEQLDEETRAAVIGNVGTLALMRIGGPDATFFETEFAPTFTPEDMVNLAKYQLYLKLMVDGVSTPPFSANTLPPISQPVGSKEKVIKVSRERYAEPKDIIQQKILKWSGFQVPGVDGLQSAKDESLVFAPVGSLIAHDPSAPPRDAAAETSSAQALKFPTIKTEDELEADARAHEHHEEILQFSPEQQAAIAKLQEKAVSSGRKKRPSYTHVCTRCGKTWELAIQLDPSRPMYCPECKPIVAAERKAREAAQKSVVHTPPPPESEVAPHHASDEGSFVHQSSEPVVPSRVRIVQQEPAPAPRERSERPHDDERSRDDGRSRERRRERDRDRDRDRRRSPERGQSERREDRRDERRADTQRVASTPSTPSVSSTSQPSNATRVLERLRDQQHDVRHGAADEPPSTPSTPLNPDTHVRF